MAKFAIEIVETLSKVVYVEAENFEQACDAVYDDYRHQRIVLDAEDCIDYYIDGFEVEER